MFLHAELSGVPEACDALSAAIEEEVREAAERSAKLIADSIRQTHPFQNRSHALEDSIAPVGPRGSFLGGRMEFGADATARYAGYVNARPEFEFMQLGYLLVRNEVDAEFDAACDRAAVRAGWV